MPDGNGGHFIKHLVESGLGYAWFILLALWGGTASYINRIRNSKVRFSFVELVGELTISGFAGLMTALVCNYMGFDLYLTAALAGISGHMGGRSIFILEKHLQSRFYWKPQNGDAPKDEPSEKWPGGGK